MNDAIAAARATLKSALAEVRRLETGPFSPIATDVYAHCEARSAAWDTMRAAEAEVARLVAGSDN